MHSSLSKNEHQERIASIKSADHKLFLSLVETYERMLLKVCWAYTRTSHDRDDLFQEIVIRLWTAFGTYDRSRTFSTWMYRVALNVAIDFRRRRQRRETVAIGLDATHHTASPHDQPKQEQIQELRELLERQNEADRAVLLLCLEGNSYREIAEIIGISESNVGTRLSRLKKALRDSVNASNE